MTIMLVCNRAEQCVCNGDRVWQDIRCHHCQLSIHPPKKIFNIFILSYDFLTVFFSSQQCNAKYIFPACKMHFFRLQIKDIGCHDCQLSLPSPQKYPTLISFQCFTFFFALPLFAPGDRSSLRHSVPLCQCRSGSNAFTRPRSNVIPESPGPV